MSYNSMVLVREFNIEIYFEKYEILFYYTNLRKNAQFFWVILNLVYSFKYIKNNSSKYSLILDFFILSLDNYNEMMTQHIRI